VVLKKFTNAEGSLVLVIQSKNDSFIRASPTEVKAFANKSRSESKDLGRQKVYISG